MPESSGAAEHDASAFRALVSGRVQGVGYRYFALAEATALGLRGFVRNLPGGAVQVVASGDRLALERLLARLRAGPPGARVDAVEATWGPVSEALGPFEVAF